MAREHPSLIREDRPAGVEQDRAPHGERGNQEELFERMREKEVAVPANRRSFWRDRRLREENVKASEPRVRSRLAIESSRRRMDELEDRGRLVAERTPVQPGIAEHRSARFRNPGRARYAELEIAALPRNQERTEAPGKAQPSGKSRVDVNAKTETGDGEVARFAGRYRERIAAHRGDVSCRC
jgi:hypothetical protein